MSSGAGWTTSSLTRVISPSPCEPCALSTPTARPRPCKDTAPRKALAALMGVVFGRRANGAARERAPCTNAQVGAVARRALGSSDYTDAQAVGAGCVGACVHHAGDGAIVAASLHHKGGDRAGRHRVEERQDRAPEPVLRRPVGYRRRRAATSGVYWSLGMVKTSSASASRW